jgi:hypothetical protein
VSDNFQQLIEDNRTLVSALKRKGAYEGFVRLLTDLYPDSAHFIYELLQNAEDAGATEVCFTLKDDSIEFKHNGDRLFSFDDVKSITNIGDSTKREDPTNIGKFGVGFKAVFAYTSTPEIESGEYHFRIRDMVVPDTGGLTSCALGEKETRMIFPFDNPRKPSAKALSEIERNLRQLKENTLLFLNNIRKIEYRLPDSTIGSLELIPQDENIIKITVRHPENNTTVESFFLRFEKRVNVNDEDDNLKSCRIAVAFGLEKLQEQYREYLGEPGNQPPAAKWRITPLVPGQVSIYFPADKETSNLRFHIHAPFASTVARDSVRNCTANNDLRDHLANLIAESLANIRDHGLLTVDFLATLPNDKDGLPPFYKPIQDNLIKAFRNEDLTPMKQGGHAAATGIFRGPVQLSSLISDDDMATVMGDDFFPPMWVANPRLRNQREDSFLSSLDIKEWTTEDLVNVLSAQSEPITKWLVEKSDEWHQQLYALLEDFLSSAPSSPHHETRNRLEKLTALRIIRISNGTYKIGKKCFFPDDGVEHDDLMPRIAKGVYTSGKSEQQQEKAKRFLETVGVRKVGEAEQVEVILKNRYSQEAVNRKSFNPDVKDIKRFITMLEKEPSRTSLFKDYFIFKLTSGEWGKPTQVYLDSPFYDTGLTAYYEALVDRSERWSLSQDFKECGIGPERIGEFAKMVGAQVRLEVVETDCSANPQRDFLWAVPGKRYSSPIDCDYVIPRLEELLKTPNEKLSKLVWRTMCSLQTSYMTATYQKNSWHGEHTAHSQLIYHLRGAEWVPQTNGTSITYVKPHDASVERLPEGFLYEAGQKWLEAIEFSSTFKKRSEEDRGQNHQAQKMGFDSAEEAHKMAILARFYKERGISPDDLISQVTVDRNRMKPCFPNRTVADPEHRQISLVAQITDASRKEYEKRDGRVRTTRGLIEPEVWLRNQYTNDDGQMVCQICKDEMPFRKRDGRHYFEAVEALSKDHFPKEHEAQFLALCPLCAAMYKEFVKHDESAMEVLTHVLKASEKSEVSLKLGEKETSIQFVESHWLDIKTILEEQD